jgi:predicted TIM-barrel fold metal-dependent hydrolase
MAAVLQSKSEKIRAKLSHPIVDSDGHAAEFEPAIFDFLRDAGGNDAVERFKNAGSFFRPQWGDMSPEERRYKRATRPIWWAHPIKNTLDRATSSLPRLMYERLDEMGLDFTMVYPSLGFGALHMPDDELRGITCRAFNSYQAEVYRPYADRLTPAALIPMHTPEEAVVELEYAVNTLGMKVMMLAGYARRPIPEFADAPPELAQHASYLDFFGIDSEYDYDPVWAKCVELKVAPTFHSVGTGWGSRRSISNFMYNHIGHFAAAAEALCKAMFFGGVTRRFPDLRCTFLEGGVGWAVTLLNDLHGHWEKHNLNTIDHCNPASLDLAGMKALFEQYGSAELAARLDNVADRSALTWGGEVAVEDRNEWAACEIERAEDIRDLFVPNFYFGCEGDDRSVGWAFDKAANVFGSELTPVYGSDISHFDLPDMRDAAEEAWEMVEDGVLDEEQFYKFVFANPVKIKTDMNPDFFKGTVVESSVDKLLAG